MLYCPFSLDTIEEVTEEGVRQLINKLKNIYILRKRIPVVPWTGGRTDRDTVRIEDVYIDPEIISLFGKDKWDHIFHTSDEEDTKRIINTRCFQRPYWQRENYSSP